MCTLSMKTFAPLLGSGIGPFHLKMDWAQEKAETWLVVNTYTIHPSPSSTQEKWQEKRTTCAAGPGKRDLQQSHLSRLASGETAGHWLVQDDIIHPQQRRATSLGGDASTHVHTHILLVNALYFDKDSSGQPYGHKGQTPFASFFWLSLLTDRGLCESVVLLCFRRVSFLAVGSWFSRSMNADKIIIAVCFSSTSL